MTQDFTTRSREEARTHELMHGATEGDGWSPARAVIAMVFRACWTSSLSLKQVQTIGAALASYEKNLSEDWLQEELTKLVRAKVLRSHVRRGERRYEVNY